MKLGKKLVLDLLKVVDKGLIDGLGDPEPGKMCVEAAIAYALGEEHTDQPSCTSSRLASIKINLNDMLGWEDEKDRAKGLRRVAIAQLGSNEGFDKFKFYNDLYEELSRFFKAEDAAGAEVVRELAKQRTISGEDLDYLVAVLKNAAAAASLSDRQIVEDTINIVHDVEAFLNSDFNDPKWENLSTSEKLHIIAECMVIALQKQKIPGTRYLKYAPRSAKLNKLMKLQHKE